MAKQKPITSKLNKKFIDYVYSHSNNYPKPDEFLKSLNQWPEKAFRINKHGVTLEGICNELNIVENKVPWCEDASYFDFDSKLGQQRQHSQGKYYIGDPSAMALVEFSNIKTNDVVIDMCAAPGGKAAHVLNKLGPEGLLIANDVDSSRVHVLQENLFRILNAMPEEKRPKVEIANLNVQDLSEKYKHFADVVILDAPCSGEAMMRRSYVARRQWSEKLITKMSTLQKMLIAYSKIIAKPESRIAYSTCTFNEKENDDVIGFAVDNLSCELEIKNLDQNFFYERNGINVLYPHLSRGDGQSIAYLKTNT